MMSTKEFNRLLKLYHSDVNAAYSLNLCCLKIIKARLLFRNGPNDLESLAHSILEKFLSKLPEYIAFPKAYLNKCTDNYLSTLKSKRKREVALTYDISYEQHFGELEKHDLICRLEKHLGKLDAALIYGHYVEDVPEKELAEENEMSYTAVRQRICRAKQKLEKLIDKTVT